MSDDHRRKDNQERVEFNQTNQKLRNVRQSCEVIGYSRGSYRFKELSEQGRELDKPKPTAIL